MTEPSIADLYRHAHRSFVDLVAGLSPEQWSTPTPCTPGWTVRDVLSHVSGVADDALAGRLDGVAGEAWTASQVERNRRFGVEELFERWAAQADGFAETLDALGERRPPFDCHSHEHDVRQALDLPGNRDSILVEASGLATLHLGALPLGVTIELDDGRLFSSGAADATRQVAVTGLSMFEVFRSRLGRRSREQVRSYAWRGDDADVDAVIDEWFAFGPSPLPILE